MTREGNTGGSTSFRGERRSSQREEDRSLGSKRAAVHTVFQKRGFPQLPKRKLGMKKEKETLNLKSRKHQNQTNHPKKPTPKNKKKRSKKTPSKEG